MLEIRWASAALAELPATDSWLGARERALLSRMHAAPRRESFCLGRLAAKRLLGGDVEVLPAEGGAPYAFHGLERLHLGVSISHRAGWGVCAAAVGEVALGCDVELIEARSAAFLSDFFSPAERATVAAASDHAQCANLIWSAKESALKALRVGLTRDTQDLEVTLSRDTSWDGSQVSVQCVRGPYAAKRNELSVRFSDLCVMDKISGRVLAGGWRRFERFVLTLVCAVEVARLSGEP